MTTRTAEIVPAGRILGLVERSAQGPLAATLFTGADHRRLKRRSCLGKYPVKFYLDLKCWVLLWIRGTITLLTRLWIAYNRLHGLLE